MTHATRWLEAVLSPRARAYLARSHRFRIGSGLLAVWVAVALLANLAGPSEAGHLAATLHGARATALVTGGVLILAVPLGWLLGLLAGAGPRFADAVLTRLIEIGGLWPTIVLLVVVRAAEPVPTVSAFVVIVGLTRALRIARLVRGEALRIRSAPHVMAARALGVPEGRRLAAHVSPLTLGPLLVGAAFTAAAAVGLEAGLSLIGLGVPERTASWGTQLGATSGAAAVGPACCVIAATAALVLLGDALEEATNPRLSLRVAPPHQPRPGNQPAAPANSGDRLRSKD